MIHIPIAVTNKFLTSHWFVEDRVWSTLVIPLLRWSPRSRRFETLAHPTQRHVLNSFFGIYAGWWLGHPSEKYELVNWDDEIPNISGKIKMMFQTTNQLWILNTS